MEAEKAPTISGLDRRTLLRTGLLAGFGAAAVGGASTLLAGTASAAQPAGVHPPGSGTPQQFDWGWCNACAGLFFLHNGTYGGICPARGYNGIDSNPHAIVKDVDYTSFNYGIYYDGSGTDYQPGWCYCSNCKGLFHQGSGSSPDGVCPIGKGNLNVGHVNSGYPYVVYHGSITGVGQPNWLWCLDCYGMFFAGPGESFGGACPTGDNHDGEDSWPYQISYNGSLILGPSTMAGPISH